MAIFAYDHLTDSKDLDVADSIISILRRKHLLIKGLLTGFCLLFALSGSFAQSNAVAALDSNLAETGNPFKVHLLVPQAFGQPADIDFSAWKDLFPEQNILQRSGWQQTQQGWTEDLTLIYFDVDTLTIPGLPLQLRNGEKILTNPLSLTVLQTPAPEEISDMSGIKDIQHEPALWSDYLPWMYGVLAVLGVVGLLFWLAARRAKKRALSRSIELPPHELALKKLDVLQQKRLWQNGSIKNYYAELSFILREYVEKRYLIPALESTSTETLCRIRKNADFPGDLLANMQELLQQADLVKFAKASPPDDFHEQALARVRKIVTDTIPQIQTPEPAEL